MSFFAYIAELWNSITNSVVGGVTYTVDWFQQLGNAVGSATGRVLQLVFQPVIDVFLALNYAIDLVGDILSNLLIYPHYLYEIVSSFFSNVGTPTPATVSWSSDSLTFLAAIPFWTTLSGLVSIGLGFLIFFFIYRAVHH